MKLVVDLLFSPTTIDANENDSQINSGRRFVNIRTELSLGIWVGVKTPNKDVKKITLSQLFTG